MYRHLQSLSYSLSHEFAEWRRNNEAVEIAPQAEYLASVLSRLSQEIPRTGTFDLHWETAIRASPEEPMFELMGVCRERLIDFVTGKVTGVQVIFQNGDTRVWKRLQRHSEFMRHYSQLAANMLKHINIKKARVIEVGGGTGATTHLLMSDPDEDMFENYVFTDVSPVFINQAKREFGHRVGFSQQPLDINRNLTIQNFSDSSIDVVIAVNVLHIADDPIFSLRRLAGLLKIGGIVILSEGSPAPDGCIWAAEPVFAFLPQWARHKSRRAVQSGFYEWKYWEHAAREAGLAVCDKYLMPSWYSDELRGGVAVLIKRKTKIR